MESPVASFVCPLKLGEHVSLGLPVQRESDPKALLSPLTSCEAGVGVGWGVLYSCTRKLTLSKASPVTWHLIPAHSPLSPVLGSFAFLGLRLRIWAGPPWAFRRLSVAKGRWKGQR